MTNKIIQLEFYNDYVDGIILELKKTKCKFYFLAIIPHHL